MIIKWRKVEVSGGEWRKSTFSTEFSTTIHRRWIVIHRRWIVIHRRWIVDSPQTPGENPAASAGGLNPLL
ncbi:MAG TPA: hypothetical protein H9674_05465 [Firmicutes bacterium]|nr:hypothetical protein [Bacillota bacterium]